MPPTVFAAVLLGAALHATWNAIVKGGSDKLMTTVLVVAFSGLVAVAVVPFLSLPAPASRPFLLASATVQLVYLALVAFCPFPVGLISEYEEDPTAFLLFAVTVGGISLLEVVLLLMAARGGHLARDLSPHALRYTLAMASSPVAVILLSLPLAAVSTTAALLSWFAMVPIGMAFDRFAPGEVRDPASRPGL